MAKFVVSLFAGVEAATLAVTWSDCGATHGKVTDVSPNSISTGETATVTVTGTVDEEVTATAYTATLSAGGVKLTSCSGDGTKAVTCKLPLGTGSIVLPVLPFPIAAGGLAIPMMVTTSASIPPSLANVDIHLEANDQKGESAVCLDVSTKAAQAKYARGFKRIEGRNANVKIAVITDEMRAAAPASLDWSSKGATTAVKDQGNCGSCWAYSATAGIESGLYMTTGQLEKLSEQQIVSCDKTDGGCDGGDLPTAFEYVQSAGGIATQSNYPDSSSDSGKDGKCKKSKAKVVKVTGYEYAIPPCTGGKCNNQKESDMMAAMNTYGPLSVCVNAENWDGYSGGIYTTKCSGKYNTLDHCVQLVGYDTTGSTKYWKVRNSWASSWGEEGFIRLPMGENACGIADEAMYVTATTISEEVAV